MRRRKLLASIAGASTVSALAGCLSDDEGDDGETDDQDDNETIDNGSDNNETDGENNESNGDGNESGEDTQTGVDSRDIETLAQTEVDDPSEDERNVESTASVSGDAETVEIEGSLEASTPCHEAVITDASVEDGTLRVHVGLEDSSEGEACAQQISKIEYSATIVVADAEPTHVVVVHTDRLREETAADTEL